MILPDLKSFRYITPSVAIVAIAIYLVWTTTAGLPALGTKVDAVQAQNNMLIDQHEALNTKFDVWSQGQDEGNRIQCATCWNSADTQEEIRRCSCNPDS